MVIVETEGGIGLSIIGHIVTLHWLSAIAVDKSTITDEYTGRYLSGVLWGNTSCCQAVTVGVLGTGAPSCTGQVGVRTVSLAFASIGTGPRLVGAGITTKTGISKGAAIGVSSTTVDARVTPCVIRNWIFLARSCYVDIRAVITIFEDATVGSVPVLKQEGRPSRRSTTAVVCFGKDAIRSFALLWPTMERHQEEKESGPGE